MSLSRLIYKSLNSLPLTLLIEEHTNNLWRKLGSLWIFVLNFFSYFSLSLSSFSSSFSLFFLSLLSFSLSFSFSFLSLSPSFLSFFLTFSPSVTFIPYVYISKPCAYQNHDYLINEEIMFISSPYPLFFFFSSYLLILSSSSFFFLFYIIFFISFRKFFIYIFFYTHLFNNIFNA